jgi:hypothetical protein
MTAAHWTWALLAAVTVSAALFFATRAPDDTTPATVANPATTAPPLNLPGTTAPSAQPASAAPPAAASTPTPATTPPTPHVGSEGYGPHIERAWAGSDAQVVWEAVQWLRSCATAEERRSSFETMRGKGISPELMTQLMVEADAEARRCQTVTAQHRAMLPELAARAMRGGVQDAAEAYANSVFPADLTAAQRKEVADALRHDAATGDIQSLSGAMRANEAWGLSDAERLTYLAAYGLLMHPQTQDIVNILAARNASRFKTPPTPQQLAQAKLAAQQIVDRAANRE